MNSSNLMNETLIEIAEKTLAESDMDTSSMGNHKLESVIVSVLPLPSEAIFLGIAEDGLPVLLNLNDPTPGPLLITGNQASGKTKLLQMIARAAELLHSPSAIQYGVITQDPEEWAGFKENKFNAGIYRTNDDKTRKFLQSLFDWAHNNKGGEQSILLFMDDLDVMNDIDPQTEQNLRWLLLRGPSRRVWPIMTANINNARNMESWLPFFRTRLFGRIQNPQDSIFITGDENESLYNLRAGSQFALREGNKWLKFTSPSID